MVTFQLKIGFLWGFLTKAHFTWAAFFTVNLFCSTCLYAPLKQGWSHFTTLMQLWCICTSINCNGPRNKHFQDIIIAYSSKIKCSLLLRSLLSMVMSLCNVLLQSIWSTGHSPFIYIYHELLLIVCMFLEIHMYIHLLVTFSNGFKLWERLFFYCECILLHLP